MQSYVLNFFRKTFSRLPKGIRRIVISASIKTMGPLGVRASQIEKLIEKTGAPSPTTFPLSVLEKVSTGGTFRTANGQEFAVGAIDLPSDTNMKNLPQGREGIFSSVEIRETTFADCVSASDFLNKPQVVVPVMKLTAEGEGTLVQKSTRIKLHNLPINRFVNFTLSLNAGDSISVDREHFLLGKPLLEHQKGGSCTSAAASERSDVTVIFIDGLSLNFFLDSTFPQLMPNTSSFFRGSKRFTNFRTCAEWTLPSVASFFTGLEPLLHGLWHPSKSKELPANGILLSEMFSQSSYLTSMLGGNWRMSPRYGYARGFDRTLYRRGADLDWLVSHHIDFQMAFPQRDHFSWISVGEIHPPWPNGVPGISVQRSIPAEYLAGAANKTTSKSPHEARDIPKELSYLESLKDLDRRLGRLYDHIREKDKESRQTVLLVSDHGQKYLTDEKSVLADARTRVPLMIRDRGMPAGEDPRPCQSSDLMAILANLLDLNPPHTSDLFLSNLGGIAKGFSLSESIYPGSHYLCRLSDAENWIEFESDVPMSKKDPHVEGNLSPNNFSGRHEIGGIPAEDLGELLQVRLRMQRGRGL